MDSWGLIDSYPRDGRRVRIARVQVRPSIWTSMSSPVVKPEVRDITGSKHPFGVAVPDTPEIIMRFGPIHYDGLPSPVQKPGSELFPVTPDFNSP